MTTPLKQTPSQTVGPYFAYGLCPQQYGYDLASAYTPDLAAPHADGEHIVVFGQVFDGNGQPVADAMIEVLQADAQGRYPSTPAQAREAGFRGFARAGTGTDAQHRFVIQTVKPGCAAADEAPHLNIIVMMRGLLTHTFTRAYFDDESAANDRDPVLACVPAERRATLLARRDPAFGHHAYRFDIHMQGPNETVFFDV
jgi:protocatechuate 3,4-dioxygenase, alpha subunit